MAHIIIIGAGASGLMAASMLLEKNHRVTILEARDRIGGRIYTFTGKFSAPVDGGAEFIHGSQALTLALAHQAGAKIIPVKGNQYHFIKGEFHASRSSEKQWDEFMDKLRTLSKDTTVASFLECNFSGEEYRELRHQVKDFAEGFDLADISKASILSLRDEWQENDDEDQWRIEGGYATLIDHLKKKIGGNNNAVLKLSTVVHEIEWSAGNVKVFARSNEMIEGDKVIVTVPLGVLQKDLIGFSPVLRHHQIAFGNMGFGGVAKILIEFNSIFWTNEIERKFDDVGFIFSDAPIPTWWSQRPARMNLLTGWLSSSSSQNEAHSIHSLYKRAIDSLCYIFQCSSIEVEKNILHYESIDWNIDLYAHGAYGYATLESKASLQLISRPVDNTIYFAGEAIYSGKAFGTVEAALISGQNVAAQI